MFYETKHTHARRMIVQISSKVTCFEMHVVFLIQLEVTCCGLMASMPDLK